MSPTTDPATGLDAAKESAGGPVELARKMGGISSQAISQWKRVPAERVLEVERVTGVARHVLRPDIYPAPERAEPAGATQ